MRTVLQVKVMAGLPKEGTEGLELRLKSLVIFRDALYPKKNTILRNSLGKKGE